MTHGSLNFIFLTWLNNLYLLKVGLFGMKNKQISFVMFQEQADYFKIILFSFIKQTMDDYDLDKNSLKPNRAFAETTSPRPKQKVKTSTTETSKSKEKQIITSFAKKTIQNSKSVKKGIQNQPESRRLAITQSPAVKKSQCQSQYFIKTAETKQNLEGVQLLDELNIKQNQLQLLTIRLQKAQFTIKQLETQNKFKTNKIQKMESEMNSLLAKSLKHLQVQQLGVDMSYECEKYRQDQRRLLKMLQTTSQYEYFAKFGLADNGIEFLRQPISGKRTTLDGTDNKKMMHFCSCNRQFIAESNFWVPQKVYNFGKEYIKQRKGEVTTSEFQLLLYQLNRIWREREKKIINSLKAEKVRELETAKRKSSNTLSLQKNINSK